MMLIKQGSKGSLVEDIQEYLGITADGIFGPKTKEAVIKFQKENNLWGDGIVGPKTMNAMGILDTDQKERKIIEGNLVINKHYLSPDEYFGGDRGKHWIFLHHTAGWNNPYNTVDHWNNDRRGRVATEFVIGGQNIKNNDSKYDGEIVQCMPEGGYGWHLGTGNSVMHRHSVGIEVCNFGYISNGRTYAGTIPHENQVVTLKEKFRGFKEWHRYSDEQLRSLRNLILYIANRDDIDPTVGLVDLIKEKGTEAFDICSVSMCTESKGLWNHTNCRKGKFDMAPQQELIDMLLSL